MLSVSISKFSNADESWSNASKNEKTIKKISPSASEAKRVSSRAHSFPRPAEFGFLPRNLSCEIFRVIRLFAAEFDVFHSNNYFFTENDLKVALLQVCL